MHIGLHYRPVVRLAKKIIRVSTNFSPVGKTSCVGAAASNVLPVALRRHRFQETASKGVVFAWTNQSPRKTGDRPGVQPPDRQEPTGYIATKS